MTNPVFLQVGKSGERTTHTHTHNPVRSGLHPDLIPSPSVVPNDLGGKIAIGTWMTMEYPSPLSHEYNPIKKQSILLMGTSTKKAPLVPGPVPTSLVYIFHVQKNSIQIMRIWGNVQKYVERIFNMRSTLIRWHKTVNTTMACRINF